jgi:acetyl-CoA carboxylase carboxyl transferase subunit beta
LGDFNFSEPNTLIAFAGPRIVKETLKLKELPEGFQRSEFLLECGFLDFIVERKNVRARIADLLFLLKK